MGIRISIYYTGPPKNIGKIYQSRHSFHFLSNLTLNKGIGYPHDKIATVEPPEIYALAGHGCGSQALKIGRTIDYFSLLAVPKHLQIL